MSTVGEIICPLLLAIGFVLTVIVFRSNEWEQTDSGTVFSQANAMTGGIWERCMNNANSGTSTCSTYDSFFLGLPVHLQGARAFTIAAIVLEAVGVLLTAVAVSFSPCASGSESARNRIRSIGSVCGGFGGLCITVAVSWFATSVMTTYYNSQIISPDAERLAFGTAIFIGWSAGAVSSFGALIAVCLSCGHSEEEQKANGKLGYYRPSQAQEYV